MRKGTPRLNRCDLAVAIALRVAGKQRPLNCFNARRPSNPALPEKEGSESE